MTSIIQITPPAASTNNLHNYGTMLEDLQRNIPGPVHIAGGAVRDTILGREIKDIDIFLSDSDGDAAAKLLRAKFGYVKVGEWRQYMGFSDPMVSRVAKFEKADETIPVCLIGLKRGLSVRENIARFDFGICMTAWEGGELITSDAFKRDVESQTFTLLRADDLQQFTYSMVRFKKLTAERYKDFTLSVPNQFEKLAREDTFRQHWYRDGGHFGFETAPQILRPKQR